MISLFNYPRCFVYAGKGNYDEYEHSGLNLFLENMYKKAMNEGVLEMKTPLKAFNTAYYLAVSLYNTPHLNLCNMDREINKSIADIFRRKMSFFDYANDGNRSFPSSLKYFFVDELLVRWFVYAILYLQKNKTEEMNEFLQLYVRKLKVCSSAYSREFRGIMNVGFLFEFQGMIENSEERYTTDLYPLMMTNVLEGEKCDWSPVVRGYDEHTILQLFSHFRTKEEQHTFLDWLKENEIDVKYDELSARIDAGEFLVASPGEDVLPALPEHADDDMKSFYANCRSVLDLNKQKMAAMEAKIKAMEEAMKSKEMTSIASNLIVSFNDKLEKEYHDYKEKAEEAMFNLKETLSEARKISAEALERGNNLAEELEHTKSALRRQIAARHKVDSGIIGRDISHTIHHDNPDEAKKAQEEIATGMIQSGVNYASDIKKVEERDTFLCIKLLTAIVDNSIKGKLDGVAGSLGNMILGVMSNRDNARKMLQEKQEEEKKLALQNTSIHIDTVEQFNRQDGSYSKQLREDNPKFLDDKGGKLIP